MIIYCFSSYKEYIVLNAYHQHIEDRAKQGIPPKPLSAEQTAELVELLKNPAPGTEDELLELITNRVPAGVDEAAYVKAGFLAALAKGEVISPLIDSVKAVELLGTMLGGYNIQPMIDALGDDKLAPTAVASLSKTLLMFDAFYDVKDLADAGNACAKQVMQSWADGEWFT